MCPRAQANLWVAGDTIPALLWLNQLLLVFCYFSVSSLHSSLPPRKLALPPSWGALFSLHVLLFFHFFKVTNFFFLLPEHKLPQLGFLPSSFSGLLFSATGHISLRAIDNLWIICVPHQLKLLRTGNHTVAFQISTYNGDRRKSQSAWCSRQAKPRN